MLCKVFLQVSPVKKAVVVDSSESLVKKGNFNDFSRGQGHWTKNISPDWGYFLCFTDCKFQFPAMARVGGGGGG